jgi:hypothetical protein
VGGLKHWICGRRKAKERHHHHHHHVATASASTSSIRRIVWISSQWYYCTSIASIISFVSILGAVSNSSSQQASGHILTAGKRIDH